MTVTLQHLWHQESQSCEQKYYIFMPSCWFACVSVPVYSPINARKKNVCVQAQVLHRASATGASSMDRHALPQHHVAYHAAAQVTPPFPGLQLFRSHNLVLCCPHFLFRGNRTFTSTTMAQPQESMEIVKRERDELQASLIALTSAMHRLEAETKRLELENAAVLMHILCSTPSFWLGPDCDATRV